MTTHSIVGPNLVHRVSDISEQSSRLLKCVDDYENVPLVSLDQAVEPLMPIISDLDRYVWVVKQRCKHPADNLTPDESAAIMLYTAEWKGYTNSLYCILNSTLRKENSDLLRPWLLYLKLFSHALSCLPSVSQTVYRGVKLDLSYLYPTTEHFIWWSFSSCTMTINVLEKEEFCGRTGPRTLFTIECINAKNIRQHSYFANENEVLLLAGTEFQVIAQYAPSSDIHVIQLKEIQPSVFLSNLRKKERSRTLSKDTIPLVNGSYKIITTSMNNVPYTNPVLEEHLSTSNDCIFLYRQKLGDRDVNIIVEKAMKKNSCRLLDLHYNEITSKGAVNLSDALSTNTTLWRLRLSNNWVSDIGAHSLALALTTANSTLRTLDLGKNGITNEGLQYLVEMLKVNKTLMDLSLYENLIDNYGIKLLMTTLAHDNRTLRWLNLADNKLIDNISTNHIVYMLKYNPTLAQLSIQNCSFRDMNKVKLRRKAKAKGKCNVEA